MKEMRRKDREISLEEAFYILEREEYGVLATVNSDNTPYAVPINYVYFNEAIYIHCALNVGHKVENFRKNHNVCFTVVGNTELLPEKFGTKYESVIISGLIEEILENKELYLEKFLDKYASEFKENGLKAMTNAINRVAIYKININEISGKSRKN